ncbi:MAG: TolC family outer membrane protein [Geminicoccaceae bacterium]|nr:TolC family outer membrane protein [Geminicoccaceae bacterium]
MAARMAGVPALALLAGVACFASTAGGGARAQTFDEALANAYRDNPRLLAARAELRAVIEEVPEAKSGYRPQLVLTGRSTHNDVDSSVSAEKLDTQEVNLRITQNLYMGGGTSAAVRSALSFVADQRALLLNTEQEVLLDAVTAYMNVLRDQRILEASAANVERLEAQMDATNTRRSVRDATVTDVNQAEARLAGARADFVQARANLQNSVASYVQVIGEVPDLLEPAELPETMPVDLEAAVAQAVENPAVQALQARVERATADVDVAFANLLPRLDVFGEASYVDEPSIFTDWQREAQVGVTLTVPLYQRGAEYSRVRQTKEVLTQRRRQLDDARRNAAEQTIRFYELYTAANDRVDLFAQQVEANRSALEGVKEEALIGTRLTLDILDAESELFLSQVELQRARRDQIVAAYSLKAAIGELTTAHLDLGVERYDAQAVLEDRENRWFGTGIDD